MKRVLVTGGASGMGRAISQALQRNGYVVDILYYSSAPGEVKPICGDKGSACKCDLSSSSGLAEAEQWLKNQQVEYYALIHNAGRSYDKLATTVEASAVERVTRLNYLSFVSLVSCLLPEMLRRKDGRIVAVGSIAAHKGSPGNAVYAGSKAALEGYVKCLATETARRNVTANVVAPGFVATRMIESYEAAQKKAFRERIPARRFADPREVGDLICYLLSDAAGYVNGTVISVDGGLGAT